jgi:CRP/FNR family transcriptional regulator
LRVLSLVLDDTESPKLAEAPREDVEANAPVRNLARDETLFEAGDIKANLYRVEAGALRIYTTRANGPCEVVEYALAGDLVGMGFLDRHADSARAEIDTTVKCLPLEAMDRLVARDYRTKARFDLAVKREFSFRRDGLVEAGRSEPLVRLAAFLVALAQQNAREGRDPTLIDDALECAVVADYLGISLDVLGSELIQLEKRGLIQPVADHGLRITDLHCLQVLANESGDGLLQSDSPGESRS